MLTPNKQAFVDKASKHFGVGAIVSRNEINEFAKSIGFSNPSWFKKPAYKVGHGKYQLPTSDTAEQDDVEIKQISSTVSNNTDNAMSVNLIATNSGSESLVPSKFKGFVPWGHYSTINQIVKSGMFYPVFVTGLSGNGKTLMVEQVHAANRKDLIRVNITIETDEDDLLGGFRLVNGETKFVPGPVVEAMEKGCTLLLDECDLGSNKLMCLQPVLEGKGVYLKKVNKWITPKAGFNILATANTKGKGSEDGRFIGTNVLNEAFLERFAITIEQPYAAKKTEEKIILGSMDKYGKSDKKFAANLCTWAEVIRKTFYDGGVDEIISTRRLDHIVKAFSIFGDKMKAIELCVARFDDDTKESFLNLYTKIDAGVTVDSLNSDSQTQVEEDEKEPEDEDAVATI
ncbi:MAG: MoxR family ATPase [Alphaproteobacteria bacterium TMED194]|nr:MAG: MoxR family ATPase [Alphaproteobacteria bacterium TMED194]|tara:strand:+ start:6124 stop:7323 length:1200 start_codon:yes stop_codon:yes gene_type:complete